MGREDVKDLPVDNDRPLQSVSKTQVSLIPTPKALIVRNVRYFDVERSYDGEIITNLEDLRYWSFFCFFFSCDTSDLATDWTEFNLC